MLTRLTVVSLLQYIQILNQYAVHQKLIRQLYLSKKKSQSILNSGFVVTESILFKISVSTDPLSLWIYDLPCVFY